MKTDRMKWKFLGPGAFDEDTSEEVGIYLKEQREGLVDQDALRYEEDGFMEGYEEGFPFSDEDAIIDFFDITEERV